MKARLLGHRLEFRSYRRARGSDGRDPRLLRRFDLVSGMHASPQSEILPFPSTEIRSLRIRSFNSPPSPSSARRAASSRPRDLVAGHGYGGRMAGRGAGALNTGVDRCVTRDRRSAPGGLKKINSFAWMRTLRSDRESVPARTRRTWSLPSAARPPPRMETGTQGAAMAPPSVPAANARCLMPAQSETANSKRGGGSRRQRDGMRSLGPASFSRLGLLRVLMLLNAAPRRRMARPPQKQNPATFAQRPSRQEIAKTTVHRDGHEAEDLWPVRRSSRDLRGRRPRAPRAGLHQVRVGTASRTHVTMIAPGGASPPRIRRAALEAVIPSAIMVPTRLGSGCDWLDEHSSPAADAFGWAAWLPRNFCSPFDTPLGCLGLRRHDAVTFTIGYRGNGATRALFREE